MKGADGTIELGRSYARPRPAFAFSALLPLLVVPGLLVARLLPETGVGLALRLAFATGCVLLPGFLVARALALRGIAATLPLALAAVALAMTVMFALGGSIETAVITLAALTAVALPFAVRGVRVQPKLGTLLLLGGGVVLGAALWRVAPVLSGDALFHLARVRKLDTLNGLSLHAVDEFIDGGLHPGYAFPLWHGFLALIADLAGVDPALVLRHESSILAPLAVLVAYEAGHALFNSRSAAVAVAVAQVGLISLAPGSGGAYNALALPPTAARQLLVPAAIALFFVYLRDRSTAMLPALAASGLAIALVHPTYAVFLAVPLAGYLLARTIMARGEFVPAAIAFGAFSAPMVAVSGALLPIVHKTVSHDPGTTALHAAIAKYPRPARRLLRRQLPARARGLRPRRRDRDRGARAAAARGARPAAALVGVRARRVARGADGDTDVGALPDLRRPRLDLTGAPRGRLPAVRVRVRRRRDRADDAARASGCCRSRSGRGSSCELAFPGDFGYRLHDGGPAYVTWTAVLAGSAAFAVAAIVRWPGIARTRGTPRRARRGALRPTGRRACGGATGRRPRTTRRTTSARGCSPQLKSRTAPGQVVFSDADTDYRIGAYLPVYVANDPPAHVADTTENRPYDRYDDAVKFLRTGDLSIPRRYGAEWIVINRNRFLTPMPIRPVWQDAKYSLYRLN